LLLHKKKKKMNRIEKLKEFIHRYKWLAEFFAIDFLTTNFYNQIPAEFKVLEEVELSDLFDIVSAGTVKEEWPLSLKEFIKEAHSLPIERTCLVEPISVLKDICIGMNDKKVKETSLISKVVDRVCRETKSNYIIDFGCGQGYLSSVLAYQFGYHVIGIDGDIKQVIGGEQRAKRILDLLKLHGHDVHGSLRFISKTIEWKDGLDAVLELIEAEYPDVLGQQWIVCGLHTCGDLASTMIKGIVKSKKSSINGLVSIGCCYQLLTEHNSDGTSQHDRISPVGFPLSESVNPYHLGLHSRMVGCSASQRWVSDSEQVKESLRRLYYRSVLQRLLHDEHIIPPAQSQEEALVSNHGERAIKKMGKAACKDPITYTKAALDRLGCDRAIPDGTVLATFEWYGFAKKQIAVIWTLRALLGDPIESLILLDRFMYTREQGFESQLVSVINPKDSPRNMALIVKRL
jgi:hypothetical protein